MNKLRLLFGISIFLISSQIFAQTIGEANEAYNNGVMAVQDKDYETAIMEFNNCIRITKDLEDEKAVELKTKVEEKLPVIYYQQGKTLLVDKDYSEAIDALKEAREVAQDYNNDEYIKKSDDLLSKAYFYLGYSEVKAGNNDKAIELFNEAVKLDESFSKGYLGLAIAYKAKDDGANFKSNVDKSIELSKEQNDNSNEKTARKLGFRYYYNLAIKSKKSTKYDESVTNCKIALEYNPKSKNALYLLASSANEAGKYDETIAAVEKIVELSNGASEEALAKYNFELARAYEGQNKKDDACAAYKSASHGSYKESSEYAIKHRLKCPE